MTLMGGSAKPFGMPTSSILICVCMQTHVYCWFCCWQTNTGLSAPVRRDPLISMETRKPAKINQRNGHNSQPQHGEMPRDWYCLEGAISVSGPSGQRRCGGRWSIFSLPLILLLENIRRDSWDSCPVFVSPSQCRHDLWTHTFMFVSRAANLISLFTCCWFEYF